MVLYSYFIITFATLHNFCFFLLEENISSSHSFHSVEIIEPVQLTLRERYTEVLAKIKEHSRNNFQKCKK